MLTFLAFFIALFLWKVLHKMKQTGLYDICLLCNTLSPMKTYPQHSICLLCNTLSPMKCTSWLGVKHQLTYQWKPTHSTALRTSSCCIHQSPCPWWNRLQQGDFLQPDWSKRKGPGASQRHSFTLLISHPPVRVLFLLGLTSSSFCSASFAFTSFRITVPVFGTLFPTCPVSTSRASFCSVSQGVLILSWGRLDLTLCHAAICQVQFLSTALRNIFQLLLWCSACMLGSFRARLFHRRCYRGRWLWTGWNVVSVVGVFRHSLSGRL